MAPFGAPGQRCAAEQDVKQIDDVYEVHDQLKVNLARADRREDDEIWVNA